MPAFALGVIVLILLLFAAYSLSKADPKQAARVLRYVGGGGALLFAIFLLVRGAIAPAVSIGLIGLGLLGYAPLRRINFGGRARKSPGQASRVRTASLEMELNHDSGALRGRVLAGRHEGTALDDLDVPTLITLLGEIDEDSIPLLAAYLDRRQPGWREEAPDDTAAADGSRRSRGGKMTEQEAYQVLGIQPGATAQDIARAHRSLIKKLHPDQGGSTYLAAQINEAKDVLTRGHH
jgi:DnaJ domain